MPCALCARSRRASPQPLRNGRQETRSRFTGVLAEWSCSLPPTMPTAIHPVPSSRWAVLLRDGGDFLVSLKLTIVLLVFSMVLVFAATLDQVNLGIWAV